MTTYNTGNPIGSTEVKDLYDNAENLDIAINSPSADVWTDRLGQARKTWRGIQSEAQLEIAQVVGEVTAQSQQYLDASIVARDEARAAASASGPIAFYGTYAAAQAAVGGLPDGGIVEVSQDETRAGARTRYKVQAGALVFVVNLDQLRLDLANDTDPAKGAALVGGVGQVVSSIAALRALRKNSASQTAFVSGYYAPGDGGGGAYWLDQGDSSAVDNGGTVVVASDGGRWKLVFSKSVFVEQFGAHGDGATDDTGKIQAAITAASASGGGTVQFAPGKTYIVAPTANTSFILQNMPNVRLQGGGGSTIRVKALSGGYLGILGVDGGNPAIFNMVVDGLTFDHDTAGNPLTTLADIESHTRSTFAVWQGRNIRFTNNTVKNDSSMLAIDINGDIVSDIVIQSNRFLNCGTASNGVDHDHSTIYMMADNVDISHNTFITDWANLSCRTAIESHGSRYAISDNTILGYICGIIITGIHHTSSTQQTVTGNSITSRAQGITVWSRTWAANTTGYGIEGVLIANNLINIKQGSYFSGGDVVVGIGVYPNATLGIKGLHVLGNTIDFEPEDTVPSYTTNSKNVGIGWSLHTITLPMVACSFKNNRVTNAPVMGIGIVGGSLAEVEVIGNTLINCARSVAPEAGPLRFPLVFLPNTSATNSLVSGNRIIDTIPVTRIRCAMFFAAQTVGSKCECLGNDISIEGGNTTAFTRSHEIDVSSNLIPFIRDTSGTGALPFGPVLDGSTMSGKGDSRTHRRIGGLWLARFWSDSIPVASGNQGDYAERRLKAVGQPKGWYCTGGTTWVSEGNL